MWWTRADCYQQRLLCDEEDSRGWELQLSEDEASAILVRVDSDCVGGEETLELEDCFAKSVFRMARTGALWVIDVRGAQRRQDGLHVKASRRGNAVGAIVAGASSSAADVSMSALRRGGHL